MRIFRTYFITSYHLSLGKRKFIIMSLLPISKAANLVGKHPTTLKAAIKKGKISASKDDNGEWKIDMAEVTRIYPIKGEKQKNNGEKNHQVNSQQLSSVLKEENEILKRGMAILETQVLGFKKEISFLESALEKSEEREKQFYELAMQNGRLLENKSEEKPKKKGWFTR